MPRGLQITQLLTDRCDCVHRLSPLDGLEDNHIAYTLRDIKGEHPTYDELAAWHRRSGLPLKKFFNTSGLLYKSMGLKEKLPTMREEEMLQLLATDGMLVKRPMLVGDDFVLVGFKESAWAEQLSADVKN